MTLEDIEALATYRTILSKEDDSPAKSLLPLIDQTLAAVQERISRIRFDG
jgi:hypothetical protein